MRAQDLDICAVICNGWQFALRSRGLPRLRQDMPYARGERLFLLDCHAVGHDAPILPQGLHRRLGRSLFEKNHIFCGLGIDSKAQICF